MSDPRTDHETAGKIFVGGFGDALTEEDLTALFSPFGTILSLRVFHKQSTFAHIVYSDRSACRRAVDAYEQREVRGVTLRVGEMHLDPADLTPAAPAPAVPEPPSAPTFGSLAVHVVLVRPAYPSNIGAVARLCANFAVASLRLVAPLCDVSDEATKLARHGAHYLTDVPIHASLSDVRATAPLLVGFTARVATGKNATRVAQTLGQTAQLLRGMHGSVALVFGNETNGLDRGECDECDILATIDIQSNYPVLNLSHAVAIGLAQLHAALRDDTRADGGASAELAGEKERVVALWRTLVERTLLDERDGGRCVGADVLRRVLGRAVLTEAEARALEHTLDGVLHTLDKRAKPGEN